MQLRWCQILIFQGFAGASYILLAHKPPNYFLGSVIYRGCFGLNHSFLEETMIRDNE